MQAEPSLLTRRKLSPQKLRAARIAAGYTNVSALCRLIGFDRQGYNRWEDENRGPLERFDFTAFWNALALFKVGYEDVTEPFDDNDLASTPQPDAQAQAVAS